MHESTVIIDARFRGPPASANGGYTCGLLAALVPGAAEVTLRAPPPLGVTLQLARQDDATVRLTRDATLIGEASPTEFALELPQPVDFDEATRATAGYLGVRGHPYPSCFVCGPERASGDGLCLYPGAVPNRQVAAAPWVPTPDLCDETSTVRPEFVWAALDCPSWWGHASFAPLGPPILLGRLSAQIRGRPRAGERCVVLGWPLGRDRRRIFCGSAVLDAHGQALAWARATWIELKTSSDV